MSGLKSSYYPCLALPTQCPNFGGEIALSTDQYDPLGTKISLFNNGDVMHMWHTRSCSRALVTRGVTSDLRFDRVSVLAEEILPLSRVEHLLRWSVNGSMQCEVLAAFDRLNSTKPPATCHIHAHAPYPKALSRGASRQPISTTKLGINRPVFNLLLCYPTSEILPM